MCGSRGGGQRRLARGGARWWRWRSNCRVVAEETQLCNKVMENGGGRQAAGCIHFFFLGGVESYLESYLGKSCPKPRDFFHFGGGDVLGRIQGKIRIGVILWSFLVILPQIYLKYYLKIS
jgi:hypothetical protein